MFSASVRISLSLKLSSFPLGRGPGWAPRSVSWLSLRRLKRGADEAPTSDRLVQLDWRKLPKFVQPSTIHVITHEKWECNHNSANLVTDGKPVLCSTDTDRNFIFVYGNIQRVTFSKQHEGFSNWAGFINKPCFSRFFLLRSSVASS